MTTKKLSQISLIVLLAILPTPAIPTQPPQTIEAERQFDAASERFRTGTPEAIKEAIALWETALKLWRESGDTDGETRTLKALGDAYFKLSQYRRSLAYHRQYLSRLNPEEEMKATATLGDNYRTKQQYEQALEFHRIFLARVQEIAAGEIEEANAFSRVGYTYFLAGQYQPALELYQRSLALRREIGDRIGEAEVLYWLGIFSWNFGREERAIAFHQQSLDLYRDIINKTGDIETLRELGETLLNWASDYQLQTGQYQPAIELYQLSMMLFETIGDRDTGLDILERIGNTYLGASDYQKASEFHQQYLSRLREEYGGETEAEALIRLSSIYRGNRQLETAINFYQQYYHILRETGDIDAKTLETFGDIYLEATQYQNALEFYQASLAILGEKGDLSQKKWLIKRLADTYLKLEQYQIAEQFYHDFLEIYRQSDGREAEAEFLSRYLGKVYWEAGQHQQAIAFYQESLFIYRELGLHREEAWVLKFLGDRYRQLEQTDEAAAVYRQSLDLYRQIKDRQWEAWLLENLGDLSLAGEAYPEGLAYYQKAIAVYREMGDLRPEILLLEKLGNTYLEIGKVSEASQFYHNSLQIIRETGDRLREIAVLNAIGASYQKYGFDETALPFYQRGLSLAYQLREDPQFANFDLTGEMLGNIASVFDRQGKTELAILFYKSAVNAHEQIRANYSGNGSISDADFASFFLTKHEADYRRLADLLLQKNRILEAQRVLDLLKIQELDDYFKDVRGNSNTGGGIPNLAPEREIQTEFDTIITRGVAIGQEISRLQDMRNRDGELTEEQEQKLAQLWAQQEQIVDDFNTFIESEEVQTAIAQLTPATRKPDLVDDLEDLLSLPDNLKALEQNAVLLYPLILGDRIELILTTPDSPPIRRTVPISQDELKATILEFRQALVSPIKNPKIPGRKLYDLIIKPVENDLNAIQAETIIYAPDGLLRYVPLAAFHDGDRWLIERYRINHITATSLTDLNTQPPRDIKLLAAAFSQGFYQLKFGEEQFNFNGLPFAGVEVENIARTLPGTRAVFNRQFNPDLIPQFDSYNIIHLATHAAVVSGAPEQSFILFGDGTPVTLEDMKKWQFRNLDLVVLSACETGLGGNFGTGVEILGLGYRMEQAGARAAIASLWSVDDGGTQALMNVFYHILARENIGKSEALRQAQIALIQGLNAEKSDSRGLSVVLAEDTSNLSQNTQNNLSHPYYWSPFIIIGNGL